MKDSKFETFWVLDICPKSTKFCVLFLLHASDESFVRHLLKMLEIRVFFCRNSQTLPLSHPSSGIVHEIILWCQILQPLQIDLKDH